MFTQTGSFYLFIYFPECCILLLSCLVDAGDLSPGDRVIDVGSEWRTFSNEKALKDPSRVGDAQNPLLNGGDLTTMISRVSRSPKGKHLHQYCLRTNREIGPVSFTLGDWRSAHTDPPILSVSENICKSDTVCLMQFTQLGFGLLRW